MKKVFDSMKIRTKVILSFSLVLVLAIFVGLVGFLGLTDISKSGSDLYNFNTLDLQYSGQASTYFQQLQYNVLKMKTITSQAEYDETLRSISDFKDLTANELKAFNDNINADTNKPEELAALTAALMSNWELYSAKIDEYFVLLEGQDTTAIADVRIFLADLGPQIREQFLQLIALAAQDAATVEQANVKSSLLIILVMGAILVITIVLSLVLET